MPAPLRNDAALACVITRDFAPPLIALYRSVLRHSPLPLVLLVTDVEPSEVPAFAETLAARLPERAVPSLRVLTLADVHDGDLVALRFCYDAFELATAGKAMLHAWMHASGLYDRWLYVDVDMLCFAPLDPLLDALDGATLLLTPHRRRLPARIEDDLPYLSAGAFNAGVVGVARNAESARFVRWYRDALSRYALLEVGSPIAERVSPDVVLGADQRWLDLVPAWFDGVRVARDRGFNLGHWNLDGDALRFDGDALYAGDDRVRLLHLSGWRADEPMRFSRHASIELGGNDAWRRIAAAYRDELVSLASLAQHGNRYACYADGTPIPKAHRRAYQRWLLQGNVRQGSPFEMRDRFHGGPPARRPVWDSAAAGATITLTMR